MSSGSTTTLPSRATASFSRGDLLDRVAEDVGVLEGDVRQEDDARAQDVRRVEPAAEARFHDGDVDPRARERGQRGSGDDLELRRVEPFGGRPHLRDGVLEVDLLPVHADPLAPARDVRGVVAPTLDPSARRSCSIAIVAVDLPFVPTTWIAGYASCGSPSSASSSCIRSSPKPSRGQGESESSQSVADVT